MINLLTKLQDNEILFFCNCNIFFSTSRKCNIPFAVDLFNKTTMETTSAMIVELHCNNILQKLTD